MQLEIETNPNCEGSSQQFMFNELGSARPIVAIRIGEENKESLCDVVGVGEGGIFTQAFAAKITDSGAGFAYVIYGSSWGIRLKPRAYAKEAWDLKNSHQWGEPFKIYGSEEDLVWGD